MSIVAESQLLNTLAAPGPASALALIGLWTLELTLVQAATLVPPPASVKRFGRLALVVRTLIDACFVAAVVFAAPRILLMVLVVLAFAIHFGLLAHYRHLHRPASLLVLLHNWREGLESWPRMSPRATAASTWWLLSALGVKLAIVALAPPLELSWITRAAISGAALVMCLALLAFAHVIDPLSDIRGSRGFGRMALIRGYFVTWLGEAYYCGGQTTFDHAVAQSKLVQDCLTPAECSIPIRDHLVIVQVETLDFNALGLHAAGKEVTPFLNRLRETSLFYRLAAARHVGSADVDFTMLSGCMPSTRIVNYKLPNFPYDNSLARFLARYGFETDVYHGNVGRFYDRGLAFSRMGFRNVFLQEELVSRYGVPVNTWGIDDTELFRLSSEQLRSSTSRECHVIITMTTHTPYIYVPKDRWDIYPQPRTMGQHFINNMRYIDDCLRNYIESLGSPATVVIYSDHSADPALLNSADFAPHWIEGREFIPCMIADTETDLSALQQTRAAGIAQDGTLTLLDISNYLRNQVKRTFDSAAAAPVASSSLPA